MSDTKLNPMFEDLNKPETLINHIADLTESIVTNHDDILYKLLKQFQKIDFQEEAFPEAIKIKEDLKKLSEQQRLKPDCEETKEKVLDKLGELKKFKITKQHEVVLSVESVIKTAEGNSWGLCKNHDFIYLYNSTYWAEIDKESFQKFLGEASEKIGVPWLSARHYQFREQLYKQFLGTAYLPTPESDPNSVFINLKNGTFEINAEGTQLRPFKRSDFLTYQLPFEYNSEETAPLFEKYLNTVLPDKARQDVLAEYLGFVFIKHGSNILKEEKALILYGTGANGKSVFFEIVSSLLGSNNTSNYSLQSLTNENGYFRAKLANKLVNYASEINGKLESSIFKQLVSGEPVEARLPYGDPFTLKQYAKLIFNCNELPKEVEHTNAYFRRFLIIPFDVTIPPHEQDKQLHTKIIQSELSGVFNWVLKGLSRLLEQKRFTECKAVQEAVEQYKKESDSVKMFIDENGYKNDAREYQKIKDLYTDYKTYCIEDGFRPVNKTNFIKRLSSFGVEVKKINIGNVAYLSNGIKHF